MAVCQNAVKNLIRARLLARAQTAKLQGELLDNNDQFHETIRVKLKGLCETTQFYNFGRCGNEDIYRSCEGCGTTETFSYRCNLKWCPRCQQRLGLRRRDLIRLWAKKITQPKHLVLTHKNHPILTRKIYRQHTVALAKFRRAKCFKHVSGGCCSTETTHEGNGWHVHAHLLINVRWLDMKNVSQTWGRLCGQKFAIVKIKDVKEADYLQEICKYVVEGSELAKWPAELINEFVQAQRGLRMFNSFGTLRDLAPQIRRELFAAKPPSPVCNCGCENFRYETQEKIMLNELREMERHPQKARRAKKIQPLKQNPPVAALGLPGLL